MVKKTFPIVIVLLIIVVFLSVKECCINNECTENVLTEKIDDVLLIGENKRHGKPSLEIQFDFGRTYSLTVPEEALSISAIYGENTDVFYVLFRVLSAYDGDEVYTVYKYKYNDKNMRYLVEPFVGIGNVEWMQSVKSIVVMNDEEYCTYSLSDKLLQYLCLGRGNEFLADNQIFISQYKLDNMLLLIAQNLNDNGVPVGTSIFKVEQDDIYFCVEEIWTKEGFVVLDTLFSESSGLILLEQKQQIYKLDIRSMLNGLVCVE